MTPRRQLRLAFGAYLDSLERKIKAAGFESHADVEQTIAEAVATYDALLKRLEDDPTTNQPAAPKPDWSRWRELSYIAAQRALTPNEQEELAKYARTAKRPRPLKDNLVTAHERVKAALRGLGTAIGDVVRFSPGGAAHPSPPTIEMRIVSPGWKGAGWTWVACLAGKHIDGSEGWPARYCRTQSEATRHGELWLAALSEQLGIKFKAKWTDA